jgi:Na+/phosphate symporter
MHPMMIAVSELYGSSLLDMHLETIVFLLVFVATGTTIIVCPVMLFLGRKYFAKRLFLKHLFVCLLSASLIAIVLFALELFWEYPATQIEWGDRIISYIGVTLLALFVGTFVSVLFSFYSASVQGSERNESE